MSKSAQVFVKAINPKAEAKHRHGLHREGGSFKYVSIGLKSWRGATEFQAWCRAAASLGWQPKTAKEKCAVACVEAWTHRNRLTRQIVATCYNDLSSIHGQGDTEGQAWSALWIEMQANGFDLDKAIANLRQD